MNYFARTFDTERVLNHFWVNLLFVSSACWIFMQSPIGIFDSFPIEKLLLHLTSENFWKFYIFLSKSNSPH